MVRLNQFSKLLVVIVLLAVGFGFLLGVMSPLTIPYPPGSEASIIYEIEGDDIYTLWPASRSFIADASGYVTGATVELVAVPATITWSLTCGGTTVASEASPTTSGSGNYRILAEPDGGFVTQGQGCLFTMSATSGSWKGEVLGPNLAVWVKNSPPGGGEEEEEEETNEEEEEEQNEEEETGDGGGGGVSPLDWLWANCGIFIIVAIVVLVVLLFVIRRR